LKIYQTSIKLKPYPRGFHIITDRVAALLSDYEITTGTINLFIKHTSASLTINENVDPSVREDMENFFSDIADTKSYYIHTYEGADDMPAHIKSSLLGQSLTIPITEGRLNIGMWQGIYLGEHRDRASSREIVVTIIGK